MQNTSKHHVLIKTSLIALFGALIAVGTFIAIPLPFTPLPVVLQNFCAVLAGLVLGPWMGSLAVLLYLIAGAIGAPVFSGASGGLVRFFGPTGGYLWGYLLSALVAGLILGTPKPEKPIHTGRYILATALSFLVIYIPGLIQMKFVLDISWDKVAIAGFVPFLFGDVLKGIAAVLVAPRLRRIVADQLYG